jgi:cysteine desulfurase
MRRIYFDYNATTPLDPRIRNAMLPFLDEIWGNPSSVHQLGQRARAHLDAARERVATVLCCKPSEITFTSGGTESINHAILGTARLLKAKGRHLLTSAIEHHAVLHSFEYLARREGFELTILPVSREGLVDPETLKKALRPDTILVSIMSANNEIGSIQPVSDLGRICRERGVLFHTDAVQWFGKEPFQNIDQFQADLVSICAHKFHGPKGAGLLYARSPLHPEPLLFGGSHENEQRAGTENLLGIIGFTEALERFVREPVFSRAALEPLTNRLLQATEAVEGVHLAGSRVHRLCNTVSLLVEGADSISLLAALDIEGICASSGSACSAGSIEPSHVISALGYDRELAGALVRFSLGRDSSNSEVELVAQIWPGLVERLRESSGKRGEYPVNEM